MFETKKKAKRKKLEPELKNKNSEPKNDKQNI